MRRRSAVVEALSSAEPREAHGDQVPEAYIPYTYSRTLGADNRHLKTHRLRNVRMRTVPVRYTLSIKYEYTMLCATSVRALSQGLYVK